MNTALASLKVERKLLCQCPMIHFQHQQPGAAIRATELRPKLDRFLKGKYGGPMPSHWLIPNPNPDIQALNYKVRITANATRAEKPHELYYGNMGSEQPKMQLKGHCQLTILCSDPGLKDFVERYIDEFILVTNFGTMQNKGFGSYMTEQAMLWTPKQIADCLCNWSGAPDCYQLTGYRDGTKRRKIRGQTVDLPWTATQFALDDIKALYAHMKGKYLLEYFQDELKIGTEKTKLKLEDVSPALGGSYRRDIRKEYRYVRALFGISEQFNYIRQLTPDGRPDWRAGKETVKIESEDASIVRFPSPIFFKIIGNSIYFVAREIDERIYGKAFVFSNKERGRPVTLKVPEKDEFQLDDFMDYFKDALNADRRRLRPSVSKEITVL